MATVLYYGCKCGHLREAPGKCPKCSRFFITHLKCVSCGQEWHGFVGPQDCPNCNHYYVEWKNYPVREPNKCEVCGKESA